MGEDACLYFKDNGSLTELLDDEKGLDNKKKNLGVEAKALVDKNYTWDIIVVKYKEIFK